MREKFLAAAAKRWLDDEPEVFPAPGFDEPGVRGIFISSHRGRRVFAWIGLPPGASAAAPVPGLVLVHGGLGTAYAHWVRYWNALGFAAIAMDTCGGVPTAGSPLSAPGGAWPRHEFSGAPGWGALDQGGLAPEEQWFTGAEAAICHAHTVLAALPEVDSGRIGITGVSWGAVLSQIAAAIDPRYRALASVYGCGFLLDGCAGFSGAALSPEARQWYDCEWDPVNHLPRVSIPNLWFNGTNDPSFPLPSWQRSTQLPAVAARRCLKLRWPHAHGRWGEEANELRAFFSETLNGAPSLPEITGTEISGRVISAAIGGGASSRRGILLVTTDADRPWPEREWHSVGADISGDRLKAELPGDWVAAAVGVVTSEFTHSTGPVFFK